MSRLRRPTALGPTTVAARPRSRARRAERLRTVGTLAALVGLGAAGTSGCERRADAVVEGRELFASACARCHGLEGTGGLAVDGGPAPRNFRDRAFQRARSDEDIKVTIVSGKGTAMPSFGTAFTETQLAALVGHVRSFDPEKGPQ